MRPATSAAALVIASGELRADRGGAQSHHLLGGVSRVDHPDSGTGHRPCRNIVLSVTRTVIASVATVTMTLAASACSASPDSPRARSAPTSSSPATSSAASPSPSFNLEDRQQFCGDLNLFAVSAGPSFTFVTFPLTVDGETPQERAKVARSVDGMARTGVLLLSKMPKELDDKLREVVHAAVEAKKRLADDIPAIKAIAPLETKKIEAARKAVVDYRGPC
jgi:hypothetical protein